MVITINNLSIHYSDKKVIDNFNETFSNGENIAFTGPSGIGKTSIANALLGLISYEGTIEYDSEPVLSAVFQEDRLCPGLSVYTNIKVTCPKLSRQEINDYIEKAGLNPSENVNTLSGGMKRRVAILRAILAPSNLLILDEPFKGLDADTKITIMELVKEKASGKTMVLITHDSTEATFFNCRVIDLSSYCTG